jgi:integrase/recombinase XerD
MSALSQDVEAYLRLRRSLGQKLADAHRLLPRFAAYLDTNKIEFVTIDAALAWSLEPDAKPQGTVWPRRMWVVRGFARYMTGIDPRTEIPPADLIPFRKRWKPPFIYSDRDIATLMTAARASIRQPLRAATYETLVGLLAVTGMRIGEAIRLDQSDVDWAAGVLQVRHSKFGKSRQVPIQPSILEALQRYKVRREQLSPPGLDESFFVSLRGTRLFYQNVLKTFRTLRDSAGVGAGSLRPPRIHDLRHSFAVRTLLGWYRDGVDVQARLPWLSTHLGHRCPSSTYLYLSAAVTLRLIGARVELGDGVAVPPRRRRGHPETQHLVDA